MDTDPVNDQKPVWEQSLLARRPDSRPALTGVPNPIVGASLLAKTAVHSALMQAGPPLSRASSAPTGLGGGHRSYKRPKTCVGAGLLAKTAVHSAWMQAGPRYREQARLPQDSAVCRNTVPTEDHGYTHTQVKPGTVPPMSANEPPTVPAQHWRPQSLHWTRPSAPTHHAHSVRYG